MIETIFWSIGLIILIILSIPLMLIYMVYSIIIQIIWIPTFLILKLTYSNSKNNRKNSLNRKKPDGAQGKNHKAI